MDPRPIHTIVIYPRPHIDTIASIFLLKTFGQEHYPGVENAKIEYWNQAPEGKTSEGLENEGVLLVDMGGGKFDHHHDSHGKKNDCAATLIAKHLGISQDPALSKLLAFVKRDDLQGKGTLSRDTIDRAFGMSAIVMNLNRDYPEHPDYVIDVVHRIFLAHYHEEYRRKVLMPEEWKQLQRSGKGVQFYIGEKQTVLKVAMIESDSKGLIGFLRAVPSVKANVVVQRCSSGHTNIVTSQSQPRIDLRPVIKAIRQAEAEAKGVKLRANEDDLQKPGKLEGVEEWYYDTAANTLQNGGAAPEGVTPTKLAMPVLRQILEKHLRADSYTPDHHPFPPRYQRRAT